MGGFQIKEELSNKQLRSFGLLVGGIFLAIALWPTLFHGVHPRYWALILSGTLILPAIIFPKILRPIYRAWMAIGLVLGWINTRIILGLVFYGMFTPIGFVLRLLRKDIMTRDLKPGTDTYRIVKQPRPSSHLKRQF